MACTKPLTGYRQLDGTIKWGDPPLGLYKSPITVACGQCKSCLLERSRQWAVRITHEAKSHEHTSFVTLTYSDDNLPDDHSLNIRDFQIFAKRLRKRIPFRYYHCGEYGDQYGRPHYHAILFGVDFTGDREAYKLTTHGDQLYRSQTLDDLWEQGLCSIGDVNFETASYVARYCMKKQTGKNKISYYESDKCDPETGEVIDRAPEYASMSLKPGIGYDWFQKYYSDVFPRDELLINGVYTRPPKYYDTLYERMNPEGFAVIKAKRLAKPRKEESLDRMIVRDICVNERLRLKGESLHHDRTHQTLPPNTIGGSRKTTHLNLTPSTAKQTQINASA